MLFLQVNDAAVSLSLIFLFFQGLAKIAQWLIYSFPNCFLQIKPIYTQLDILNFYDKL
jgi:hypothetical protein